MNDKNLRDLLEELLGGDDLTAEDIIAGVLKFRGPLLQPVLLARIIAQMSELEKRLEDVARAVLKISEQSQPTGPVERVYEVNYALENYDKRFTAWIAATSAFNAMYKIQDNMRDVCVYDLECEGERI